MANAKISTPAPTKFILPDLFTDCPYPLHVNRHHKKVEVETKQWLFNDAGNLMGQKKERYTTLKAGLLAAMVYPHAAYPQLRASNDFLTYLFHLDNLSDEMDREESLSTADILLNTFYHPETYRTTSRVGKLGRDLWRRMLRTAHPGCQQRFIETMDFFFQSVTEQAQDRHAGEIPDLESYIMLRRDTSACKPSFVLIEYINNLDLPEQVMDHPLMRSLNDAANDLVTWSNDIFSYNVEQAKGDTHNMIPVVMHEQGLELQQAVDFVGDLCKQCIERFEHDKALLPSWGPQIDKDVQTYIHGLEDWMVGSLHWSFKSERYFGKKGQEVKDSRIIHLLPKREGVQ